MFRLNSLLDRAILASIATMLAFNIVVLAQQVATSNVPSLV